MSIKQFLYPSIDDLQLECVLMQAWKKTSNYLRYHNWYADTLMIDYQSLRIKDFIKEIQRDLKNFEMWEPKQLKLIPAPKNQKWEIKERKWIPSNVPSEVKLRPLAHLDLKDQVLATALMMCLADRIETKLGNPLLPISNADDRKKNLAYGHRLFCEEYKGKLYHHWASTKLYRKYFQDYRTFLERPKKVVDTCLVNDKHEKAIIQTDLKKFYDCISPELLVDKVKALQESKREEPFFKLVEKLFNWNWSNDIFQEQFDFFSQSSQQQIALPQGLVAAGFFANIVLLDFDFALRKHFNTKIDNDIKLLDVCYYVDDFNIVLEVPKNMDESKISDNVIKWFENLLKIHSTILLISKDKTNVTVEGRENRYLIRQSKEAKRIQGQVSGAIDAFHGTQLINTILGFFYTQLRYPSENANSNESSDLLVGVPDMRDDTVARFAAGKFRMTFRSLRPLLLSENIDTSKSEDIFFNFPILTQNQLDERAKSFAALLIEEWVKNPGNIRLLRIALDFYPDFDFLDRIMNILHDENQITELSQSERDIRTFCLAEIFRAGAIETGIVENSECLPKDINLNRFHDRLKQEGTKILQKINDDSEFIIYYPWYLLQQIFLYLISQNALQEFNFKEHLLNNVYLNIYIELAQYLQGKFPKNNQKHSIFLILSNSAFDLAFQDKYKEKDIDVNLLDNLKVISPSLADRFYKFVHQNNFKDNALDLDEINVNKIQNRLSDIINMKANPFCEEENVLCLAKWLIDQENLEQKILTPWMITYEFEPKKNGYTFGKVKPTKFTLNNTSSQYDYLFEPPDWISDKDSKLLYQIGLIVRFAIIGSIEFYTNRNFCANKIKYSKPISHFEQQRYSLFNGRSSLGPNWIPISSFTEDLLYELLRWPGSGIVSLFRKYHDLQKDISKRLDYLKKERGDHSKVTILEQNAPYPSKIKNDKWLRSLRIGIVQSIIPTFKDYQDHINDPELLHDNRFRAIHRNHLASLLENVTQSLRVRNTHIFNNKGDGQLDLLIFPELSIHPDDINSLLIPFVKKFKCLILFGQVYHRKTSNDPTLINSCLWLIPYWSAQTGLQVKKIEQGKQNLTMLEQETFSNIEGFRPVQWIIDYQWCSKSIDQRQLRISASVCYDATDLALAADLRSKSDLYIVCALNKDVGTFDRMSEGLHYHMYQGVIIVNNGIFGGSNFYLPFKDNFRRQVFHLHGQPQASIAFAEICPKKILERPNNCLGNSQEEDCENSFPKGKWKTPPIR